jgi:KRAB domain-containing zinc finger protein
MSLKPRFKKNKVPGSPQNLHRCYFCSKSSPSLSALLIHMAQHTTEKPYKCQKCVRSFGRQHRLVEHISRNCCVPGGPPKNCSSNKCFFCKKDFPVNSILNRHLKRAHLLEGFSGCHICSKQFTNNTGLEIHIRVVHLGERNFKCGMCYRTYKTRSCLNEHIRETHTRERTFICYFCNKSDAAFTSAVKLMRHMRRHTGEKPFFCYFCNVQFAHDSTLNSHMLIIHIKERPFRCSKCPDREFTLSGQLNHHIRRRHTQNSSRTVK